MKINNSHLVIIIVSVIILVAICIIYLIANRGNEKVVELSFKSLLVPVVIAFGLFLFEFLKPLDIKTNKVVFCITEEPMILHNLATSPTGSYGLINRETLETFAFFGKNKDSLPLTTDKNKIEIAEIIILHLLNRRYSQHWQIDYERGESFFDMESSLTSQKNNADKNIHTLNVKTLHNIYPKDHLIQKIDDGINFVIPENTTYEVSGNNFQRKIQLSNKYITANITIEEVGVGTLPHVAGRTAFLIRQRLNLPLKENYRLDFYGYVIKIKIKPNRMRKWNPRTLEQTEWLTKMFEYLKMSYGWETIIEKLEENNYS